MFNEVVQITVGTIVLLLLAVFLLGLVIGVMMNKPRIEATPWYARGAEEEADEE